MPITRNLLGSGTGPQQAQAIVGTSDRGKTATGTTRADAFLISEDVTTFTVVPSGTGAALRTDSLENDVYTIINDGSNALAIYPPAGGRIGTGATNAAYSLPAGTYIDLQARGYGVFMPRVSTAAQSTFIAAGTGSVTRPAQDKMRERTSVEDKGAVGNGVTSSATAFSNSYSEAIANATICIGPGNFVTGTVTGSKSVLWKCDGSMNAAGNAPLDLPGIVETMFERRKLIRQSQSTATDYAAIQVQRVASHTGGTAGFVNAGFRSDITVGAGVTNFEWAVVGSVDNYAAAGENTGVYGQGFQRSTGATWGGTFEARDLRNTSDTLGALVGAEVDVFANGTDANNTRVGLDVVVGKGTSGGTKCTAYVGLRITPVNADTTQGKFKNGIILQGECDTGISLSSTGVDAIQVSGSNSVGVNLSLGTFSGSAMRLARAQKIAFENTDALMQYLDGAINVMRFDNAGTERVGLDMRAASPGLRVNGTQVVGPRDTGWTAMTGTANENSAYDTSSVTLPQLAGRVMAIQAALTLHGMIGT